MPIQLHCLSSPQRKAESFFQGAAELGGASWFNVPLLIDGETNVFPPKHSIAQRVHDSREWLGDLGIVDGLPQLAANEALSDIYEIGKDQSGHEYYVSGKSGHCYAWWHDPDRIEHICDDLGQFLDWMIEEQPEHPTGCPWATFSELGLGIAPHCVSLAHSERYPVEKLCKRVEKLGGFGLEHVTSSVAHLLQPEHGRLITMAHDLRGFFTKLDVQVPRQVLEMGVRVRWTEFVQRLNAEGFCDPDSLALRRLNEEGLSSDD